MNKEVPIVIIETVISKMNSVIRKKVLSEGKKLPVKHRNIIGKREKMFQNNVLV